MAGPVQFERRVFPVGAPMDLVSGAATPTDLTFTVASVDPSVPTTGPGYVIFDLGLATEDATRWISRSGNTFTVPDTQSRGVAGTVGTGHNPGSGNVVFGFVSIDFDEANYWVNQLGQIQAPGDMYQGAGDNLLQVTPIGSEGQRWVVTDGIGGWVDPELPASATDGWVLTQEDDLPVWQTPFTPLLDTTHGAGPFNVSTTTPTALAAMTLAFVVPPSGNVLLRTTGGVLFGSDGNYNELRYMNGASIVGVVERSVQNFAAGVGFLHFSIAQVVTGLTVGASLTLALYGDVSAGSAGCQYTDLLLEAWSA